MEKQADKQGRAPKLTPPAPIVESTNATSSGAAERRGPKQSIWIHFQAAFSRAILAEIGQGNQIAPAFRARIERSIREYCARLVAESEAEVAAVLRANTALMEENARLLLIEKAAREYGSSTAKETREPNSMLWSTRWVES
jgi:hypothetical protein